MGAAEADDDGGAAAPDDDTALAAPPPPPAKLAAIAAARARASSTIFLFFSCAASIADAADGWPFKESFRGRLEGIDEDSSGEGRFSVRSIFCPGKEEKEYTRGLLLYCLTAAIIEFAIKAIYKSC